ncbi:MAG: hydrogenase iron-sulfur subunit [Chloroflexi bacterium]|nr:hydrogenase iron-sulfur subunit [Chloroflexota bacterium]
MAVEFEPKIVGFLCNWCSYAGADMAGTSRMSYPTNIRIIRVPCSGRIDPLFVAKAFQMGADGVLIAGCHPGDCHYAEGNYHLRRRFALLRPFLDYLGIDKERFRLEWVSASEGKRFTEVVTSFTEQVRRIGPRVALGGPRAETSPAEVEAH